MYDEIVEQQVIITYLSNGITFKDTEDITPYDRNLILSVIKKIKEEERKSIEENKA